jgi:hypothetical protein
MDIGKVETQKHTNQKPLPRREKGKGERENTFIFSHRFKASFFKRKKEKNVF